MTRRNIDCSTRDVIMTPVMQ